MTGDSTNGDAAKGFSADWLALREPVDHRARDARLVAALAAALEDRWDARGEARGGSNGPLAIVDLGCGLGSNLRALADHLPGDQDWLLVDHDPALLARARDHLAAWGDKAWIEGEALHLHRRDKEIRVRFRTADLAGGIDDLLGHCPDCVTAAALFDLCSQAWIVDFAAAIARSGAVFYTALTYDGLETWTPPHPADEAVLAAFHTHQRGDKGFGASSGPDAPDALARAFRAHGYAVDEASSPWRLDAAADGPLMRALAAGAADAVAETGRVAAPVLADWRASRIAAEACLIGHRDTLAVPRR